MSQQQKNKATIKIDEKGESMLDQMFNAARPNARYVSQMHIEEYTDSIYKQIINGDIEVSKQRLNIENSPDKYDIEQNLRKKFMSKAEKERQQLEHRLGYLTNSINSMKKYDQLRAAIKSPRGMRASFSGNDSRYKDQEWRQKIQKRAEQLERRKKLIQQQKRKKAEEVKQSQERTEEQKQQEKKRNILQHMKAIEERMKKRQEQYKISSERYAKVRRQKSMYERISETYEQKQKSVLEQRKKRLAEIRNFHQPINEEQIKQHENKFLQLKRQKQQMRERERRMNESRNKDYKPHYQSMFYRKILDQEKEEPENQVAVKTEKMKQFSDHVREHFAPHIDERKKQQIQDLIERQKEKQQELIEKQKELLKMSKMKGMEYLNNIRNLPKKKTEGISGQSHIFKMEPAKTQRIVYKNYLTHHTTDDSSNSRRKSWSRILQSNEDKQSKALKIQFESQRLEEELSRKEKQARLLKKGNSAEIDQQYFEMIKAKLDLLK